MAAKVEAVVMQHVQSELEDSLTVALEVQLYQLFGSPSLQLFLVLCICPSHAQQLALLDPRLKYILHMHKQILPQFPRRLDSQEGFLSSVEEDGPMLLEGDIFLGFQEGLTPQGYVVHLGANKQGVPYLAILAHLLVPFMQPKMCLISALMIQLEISLRFSQSIQKMRELKTCHHTILLADDIIHQFLPSDQHISVQQLRLIVLVFDLNCIQYGAIQTGSTFLVSQTNHPLSQHAYLSQPFSFMRNVFVRGQHLYGQFFTYCLLGLTFQREEERQRRTEITGTLLNELLSHLRGQTGDQGVAFLYLKCLLDLSRVDDVLTDGVMQIFINVGNNGQSTQHGELLLDILRGSSEGIDNIAHLCDVIRKDQTAKQNDDSQHDCLNVAAYSEVSEAHSGDDTGRPVQTVDILHPPHLISNIILIHPIWTTLYQSQFDQQSCHEVYNIKVTKQQFKQFKNLFFD